MPKKSQARSLASIKTAAEVWSVHPRTIRRRISDGTLTGYRLPGSRAIRVDLNELEAAMTSISTAGAA